MAQCVAKLLKTNGAEIRGKCRNKEVGFTKRVYILSARGCRGIVAPPKAIQGAFTGALMQRKGRFEIADRGTLFLDEIGDISMELQPKLLRAVQEQEFERLGSTRTIQVNVRLIAATHRG